jgi:transcriptional regulator with XRE-family HTH domain
MEQAEVAEAVGKSERTIRRWEAGGATPKGSSPERLRAVLGIEDAECLRRLGISETPPLALLERARATSSGGGTKPSRDEVLRALLRGLNKGRVKGDNFVAVARVLAQETGIDWPGT